MIRRPMKIFIQTLATMTGGIVVNLSGKPPNILEGLVLCFLVFLAQFANGNSCSSNQVIQCNSISNCSCVNCLICPLGQGLYPPCVRTEVLTKNNTMKCLPCKSGTYSDKSGIGPCHSCQQCQGTKTLVECNATHDAVCSKECMHGFQWDDLFEMCDKVPITVAIEKPRVMTPKAKSSQTPASTATEQVPTIDQSIVKTISTERKDLGTKTPDVRFPTSRPGGEHYKTALIVLAVFFVHVIVIVFLFIKRKKIFRFICNLYCSCRGISSTDQQRRDSEAMSPMQPEQQGQDLEEIITVPSDGGRKSHVQLASGPKEENDNLIQRPLDEVNDDPEEEEGQPKEDMEKMPCNPNLDGTRLSEISKDLQHQMAVQISKKHLKGWEEIGTFCNVPKTKLEEIKTKSSWAQGTLPGEFLLEFLQASQPDLTLKEFTKFLKSLNREDVISDIKKEYVVTV